MTDKWTGEKTVLSKEDVEAIKRMQKGLNPSSSQDMYPVSQPLVKSRNVYRLMLTLFVDLLFLFF